MLVTLVQQNVCVDISLDSAAVSVVVPVEAHADAPTEGFSGLEVSDQRFNSSKKSLKSAK
jgi:hypothetical protein